MFPKYPINGVDFGHVHMKLGIEETVYIFIHFGLSST